MYIRCNPDNTFLSKRGGSGRGRQHSPMPSFSTRIFQSFQIPRSWAAPLIPPGRSVHLLPQNLGTKTPM